MAAIKAEVLNLQALSRQFLPYIEKLAAMFTNCEN